MELSLYVAQLTGAAERTQRLAVTDLPPALNGEPLRPAEMPWWRPAAAERRTGALPEAALCGCGASRASRMGLKICVEPALSELLLQPVFHP